MEKKEYNPRWIIIDLAGQTNPQICSPPSLLSFLPPSLCSPALLKG